MRFPWQVEVLPPVDYLSPKAVLTIQRMLLEAIANALRHARATTITVGFDPAAAPRGRDLGNLRSRAHSLGGAATIDSSPAGTRVTLGAAGLQRPGLSSALVAREAETSQPCRARIRSWVAHDAHDEEDMFRTHPGERRTVILSSGRLSGHWRRQKMFAKWALGAAVAAAVVAGAPSAGEAKNPIFGNAAVSVTNAEQNKSVLGKGYYADYYASYGISYADAAAAYGSYGYYDTAASLAYDAYSFFSTAAYYQSVGY